MTGGTSTRCRHVVPALYRTERITNASPSSTVKRSARLSSLNHRGARIMSPTSYQAAPPRNDLSFVRRSARAFMPNAGRRVKGFASETTEKGGAGAVGQGDRDHAEAGRVGDDEGRGQDRGGADAETQAPEHQALGPVVGERQQAGAPGEVDAAGHPADDAPVPRRGLVVGEVGAVHGRRDAAE